MDASGKTSATASQWLIDRFAVKCDPHKLKKASQVKVSEAWSGKLLSGDPIYACVTPKDEVISGLSVYTKQDAELLHQHGSCQNNGGVQQVQRIKLAFANSTRIRNPITGSYIPVPAKAWMQYEPAFTAAMPWAST